MSRQLGEMQLDVLRALAKHSGHWAPGCGWYWTNDSTTARVLRSLARRGLVHETPRAYYSDFHITDPGREAAKRPFDRLVTRGRA